MAITASTELPAEDHGLIHAGPLNDDGPHWVHLERGHDNLKNWLQDQAGVPALYVPVMVEDAARPRADLVDDHALIVLRGANTNDGDAPHDLIGLRLWVTEGSLVTVRLRPVRTINAIRQDLEIGKGPANAADFLTRTVTGLTERLRELVDELEVKIDGLEEHAESGGPSNLREQVVSTRHVIAGLRRYMAPQRDALFALAKLKVDWLEDSHRDHIREQAQNTVRIVEVLEELKERTGVIHDDLMADVNERMNRTMYMLALVSILLLPPSLLTGLFGINVGGMPMVESGFGFWIVLAMVPGLILIFLALLKKLRWL
ncbi:MAG: CorA family divalent cation transporter [Alphaproteobacteria bacterium]